MIEYIVPAIIGIIFVIYKFMTWNYNYWQKLDVPCLKAKFLWGNVKEVFLQQKSEAAFSDELYYKFKDYNVCGFYTVRRPSLYIRDVDLIRNVLVKDYSHFQKNDFHLSEDVDPIMGKNPFFHTGDRWKLIRGQLSPNFTPSRLKISFPLILDVTDRLVDYISKNVDKKEGLLAKELAVRYTIEVVVSLALSINAKTFENPKAEFREMSHQIIEGDNTLDQFKFMIMTMWPWLGDFLRLKFVSKKVDKFFRNVIRDSLQQRKNSAPRYDFLEMLTEIKKKCSEYNFTEDHMVGHIVTFFTEGSETSSITLSYTLYEIAYNQEIFMKLRAEIDEVLAKNNGKLTFELLSEMSYLECIMQEVLRKHPAVFILRKLCTSPYKIPHPKKKGEFLTIKPETSVILPVYSVQHDPNYYPNPEVFDPDRFSEQNKNSLVKGTFLTFGDGPRICVGAKLAMTQVKAAIIAIVKNFDVKVNPRTDDPLEIDPTSFMLKTKNGIWLDFSKRSDSL